jgi:archaellum component FlaF (FlaF/FlaG flagellin family)
MIFTNNTTGLHKVITTIILTSFIFLASCSENIENYSVSVTNNFFEKLHNIKISSVQFDSLSVNETTPIKLIEKGSYVFSCETESNLVFTTNIVIGGNESRIKLFVDEHGNLSK